jgi:hypothetical protein
MNTATETTMAAPQVGGSLLSPDALNQIAADRQTIPVAVNDKGDFVYVTELSGSDRDWLNRQVAGAGPGKVAENMIAKLIVCGYTDEHGKRIYGRNQWNIVAAWKSSLQQRLFDAITNVSGMDDNARADFLANSRLIDSDD